MSGPIVLILAAGKGTRMKSERAKVLHEVAGKPMIAWAIDSAREAGASKVVAILGHQLDEVQRVLEDRYGSGKIGIAHQKEQKGTGHAVQCGIAELGDASDDDIVVILTGDAPLLPPSRVKQLVDACKKSPAKMALLSSVPTRPVEYGHLLRDDKGKLVRIVEHGDATDEEKAIEEVNVGFYAASLGVLRRDLASLQTNNAQGEFYLTDLASNSYERGGAEVISVFFDETSGVNDPVDLAAVTKAARENINNAWMRNGVTMISPENTYIDADVLEIGSDTVIEPGARILGKTKIGTAVRIGANVCIRDSEIGDNSDIGPGSQILNSRIGEDAALSPFVVVHADTEIGNEAQIGSFTELRNAQVMEAASIGQLIYIGDATVGKGATMGAGAVTCDFDGARMAKTTIEADAFVGAGAKLIAPATVGRDSYVGAGTVVTRDVPRGSLALSRVKQVNIDGWGKKFREALSKRKPSSPGK